MTSKINTYKRFTSIFLLIFSLFIGFSTNLSASEPQEVEVSEQSKAPEASEENRPIDISAIAIIHIESGIGSIQLNIG